MSRRVPVLAVLLLSAVSVGAAEPKPRAIEGYNGVLNAVSLSADGKLLAGTGGAGDLCVWDVAGGKVKWRHAGVTSGWGVAFSPDGKRIAVPGNAGSVVVYDAATGKSVA